MQTSYLIVPALTDQAGQCRIVSRSHEAPVKDALAHYRWMPDEWREAGIMNSQGTIVCLNAPDAVVEDMKSCEPLMAGSHFHYDETEVEHPAADLARRSESQR